MKSGKLWGVLVMSVVLACALVVGCSQESGGDSAQGQGSSATSSAADAASTSEYSQDDIRAYLMQALAQDYSSVTFDVSTTTKALYATQVGTQQSSASTTMKGELARDSEGDRIHMSMATSGSGSNSQSMEIEVFLQGDSAAIVSDGQVYSGSASEAGLSGYAESVTAFIQQAGAGQLLDTAGDMSIEFRDGETLVTIVSDQEKLAGSDITNANQNAEQATIQSLVTMYTLNADDRVTQVSMVGGTAGTPSYSIRQVYKYSDYNATEAPEMPATSNTPAIQTDENGNQYIVDDDGNVYYVDHIGDDGMVYFYSPSSSGYEAQYVEVPTGVQQQVVTSVPQEIVVSGSTSGGEQGSSSSSTVSASVSSSSANVSSSSAGASASSSSGSASSSSGASSSASSSTQGRAYITDDSGKRHYLDEEGSRIITSSDGSRIFIDADGNLYFLSE